MDMVLPTKKNSSQLNKGYHMFFIRKNYITNIISLNISKQPSPAFGVEVDVHFLLLNIMWSKVAQFQWHTLYQFVLGTERCLEVGLLQLLTSFLIIVIEIKFLKKTWFKMAYFEQYFFI